MSKILVVAAHPDDEILGIGGTIIKHINEGNQINILILGDGETSKNSHIDYANVAERESQAKKAAKALGAKEIILDKLPDNKFDSLPLLEIAKKVEIVVSRIKPEIVYSHCPTDLNIDHRLTFQAVLTACRPQPGFFVKKILAFETPSSTEWQIKDAQHIFCPTEYIDISNYIDKKIEILKIYKDELKQYPHPRSIEGIRILSKYRGMEVGYKHAEAFQLIRNLN